MKYQGIKIGVLLVLFWGALYALQASSTENFASFLAGILLIQENKDLSNEQKAHAYLQLQKITGISSSEAIQLISSFRDRPEEFKQIHLSIKAELTGVEKDGREALENKTAEKK